MNKYLLILIFISLYSPGYMQEIKVIDCKNHFDKYGVDGCFLLYDKSNDLFICYNQTRCDSGFLPASTFKIPNAVIALEEKVIQDTSQTFQWYGRKWPNENWNLDQTLGSAMKYSCVWVFFFIAEKVGIEKYYQYINSFNYGNMNLNGPPTRFWLTGELRINAFQQLEFLRKFYDYELNVSRESVDMVKDMIILEKTDNYILSGKTGGTEISENSYIMWLVGYIELNRDVYFYALNFSTDDYSRTQNARYEITRSILNDLRLIE